MRGGLLLLAALACNPAFPIQNEPFRFWKPSELEQPSEKRWEHALDLETGEVVDLCEQDAGSDACARTMRTLMGAYSERTACSPEDWARKFVARARNSSRYLAYWRSGSALVLMRIVIDDAEYGHGFSCED